VSRRVEQHDQVAAQEQLPTSNSALVHRAVKALRRDGDAALAASLLEENRKRYPNGPLAEEALSLQIEAALALHDARARAFAREYMTRYPNGRYLEVARRALQDAAP
jgi:outer membrane protein assembly factor BamD (BamD/ComL family)